MITVSIIGSGNVAQHLISAFTKATEINLVQVYVREMKKGIPLLHFDQIVTDFEALKEVDLFLIAVSDDAIVEVSKKIPFKNALVAHTSGSISMSDLATNRKAVFYPLQTFSKNKVVDFKAIPIGIESDNEADFLIVEKVAQAISNKVFAVNSEQRKALHLAAVFVNNFVNHLYQIGAEICKENDVPFEMLKPLIKETAEKVMLLSPEEAQTGPAKRNDQQTIAAHFNLLKNQNQKAIYTLLTQSIQSHE